MKIHTKFNVGEKVQAEFDDCFFFRGFGIIREINIAISAIGFHVSYKVADVSGNRVLREFTLDEMDLIEPDSDCTCVKTCDCQRPPTHISNECPIHNENPFPAEDCPIHLSEEKENA